MREGDSWRDVNEGDNWGDLREGDSWRDVREDITGDSAGNIGKAPDNVGHLGPKKEIEAIRFYLLIIYQMTSENKILKISLIIKIRRKTKAFPSAYFNFSSAACSFSNIAGISSFTQVPTLRRYHGEFFADPKAENGTRASLASFKM